MPYVPLDIDKIKALRLKRGLSQAEAARLAGIKTRQRWTQIEKGQVPNLTLKTLEKIARAMNVRARDLLK